MDTPSKDLFYELEPRKYTIKKLLKEPSYGKDELIFRHGHIAITNYHMGDNREFEKSLSVFDEMNWKYELKGGYYVKPLKEFRINRGYNLQSLMRFFPNYTARVENDPYPSDKIQMDLLVPPRDDFQKVALTFMCSQGAYHSNVNYTQQMIEAKVGFGKTYCGVATTCFLQARVVIIVPIGKLLDQWKQSFLDFTNIKPDEILIVQGSATCKKILDGKYSHIKVFIFSADTIVSFHDQYGDLETIELLRATNAYMKIVDEVHRDMKAIAMIEALSNFRMNYYMSASPDRSDKKESWIFKTCFKNVPKFGKDLKLKSDDHLNVIIKNYSFVPNQIQVKNMVNARTKWLNNRLYENELFNAPDIQKADFVKSLKSMLVWAKKNLKDSNKIMILCQTVDGTEFLQKVADELFPNETARYYGSMKPAEKEEALKHRVICATSSSLGTGADIKGIQFVINVGTYANKIDAIQISGRARRIEGTEVFYIELVNIGYRKTFKQYENRKQYLVQASKTGKLIVID